MKIDGVMEHDNKYKEYMQILEEAQRTNKNLGYGDNSTEWKKKDYNITLQMLKKSKTRKQRETCSAGKTQPIKQNS